MTTRELMKQLLACNPDAEIYLSIDEEGNEFKEIDEISTSENKLIIFPL